MRDDDEQVKENIIATTKLPTIHLSVSAPRQPCLTLLTGMDAGRVLPLGQLQHPVTIGRSSECDVWIDQHDISRVHAVIERTPGGLCLRDLGSSNGTSLNGQRVVEAVLSADDKIQLGAMVILKLSYLDDEDIRHHQNLFQRAVTDHLTGIMNRSFFLQTLEREWSFARRHQAHLSLAMMDIDHFKRVNDALGHLAGDSVLVEVCRRVLIQIRLEDLLARYGGEEFVVLFRNEDVQGALCAANRIRTSIETEPFEFEGSSLSITLSIGVVGFDPRTLGDLSTTEAIELADKQLYRAKSQGRNQVCTPSE